MPAAGDRHEVVAEASVAASRPVSSLPRISAVAVARRSMPRAAGERGADDAVGVPQAGEGGGQASAVEHHMLEPAFGHPIARIRRQCLVGTVGQHDPSEPEKCGAADDRTEIVRVADAVEDQQRLAVLRPRRAASGSRSRSGRGRATATTPPCNTVPATRASSAAIDLAVGLIAYGRASGRMASTSPLSAGSKNSRSTRPGSRSNRACTAASPQIRSSSRSCGGRPARRPPYCEGGTAWARHRARRRRGRGATRVRAHIHHVTALIDAQADPLPHGGGTASWSTSQREAK